MSDGSTKIARQVCPNCGNLNSQNARICVVCGVNITGFILALPRMQQLWENYEADERAEIEKQTKNKLDVELQTIQRSSQQSIRAFLIIAVLLLSVGLSVRSVSMYLSRKAEAQLPKKESAILCINSVNYMCVTYIYVNTH
jgi:hypothetical protein